MEVGYHEFICCSRLLLTYSQFVQENIVDPLGKTPLEFTGNQILSDYGRSYPILDGYFDFRINPIRIVKNYINWHEGQIDYEDFYANSYLNESIENLKSELNQNAMLYSNVDFLNKNILDVGGGCGLLRAFLSGQKNYVIIDPQVSVLLDSKKSYTLSRVYPFVHDPVDFVIGNAEFIPFKSNSFDIVHIRSAIDHFFDPQLAIYEAYRVLAKGGSLIMISSLENHSKYKFATILKSIIKILLRKKKTHDHHSWHPNRENLRNLVTESGFSICSEKVQKLPGVEVLAVYCKK